MMLTNENGIRILTPSEGMYLTNGDTYSQRVYLGKNDSNDGWWEVDNIPEEVDDPELSAEESLAELVEVL